jgi:hypothetical protein
LLLYLPSELSSNLKTDLPLESLSLAPSTINNLRLLIVGGEIDEHQLNRKAFALLNETRGRSEGVAKRRILRRNFSKKKKEI